MTNLITVVMLIAVLLGGTLTLAQSAFIDTDRISQSWKVMQVRTQGMEHTEIASLAPILDVTGGIIDIPIHNKGQTSIGDFSRWDVILKYFKKSGNKDLHIARLSYTQAAQPGDDEWTITKIYKNTVLNELEVYEPNILNPGEVMVIRIKIIPPVAKNSTHMASINAPNGVSVTLFFER